MPDGPASHVGREGTFEALGRTWTFCRWNRRVWVDLTAQAKAALPDPQREMLRYIDELALKDFEVYRKLLKNDQAEQAKAKEERRDPVCVAGLFKPMADAFAEKALDKVSLYLQFHSAEMQSYIRSVEGASWLLYRLLRPHQPDVTEDLAYEISDELGSRRTQIIFETARGKEPPPNGQGGPAESFLT